MNRLLKIAQSGTAGEAVQFRKTAYGSRDVRRFLRDVIAIANANIEGSRHIVVGVEVDRKGNRRVRTVPQDDFDGKPSYQSLVADFVEPPIRLKYQAITLEGKQIGVFEIGDCQDRPYMMRIDQSEKLRRGDAYIRVSDTPIKMGRAQLQDLFEKKFRDSVSATRIEIGFPGEIIHKDLKLPTVDLSEMPSAIANAKLKQMLEVQTGKGNHGSSTVMARLMHARLFGADNPYEDKSPSVLMQEIAHLKQQHYHDDQHFLFEANGSELQLVVYNQGDEPIQDASISIVMPNHNAFYVAPCLPRVQHNGAFVDQDAPGAEGYPSVVLKDDTIKVTRNLGDVSNDAPMNAFETPLRICIGTDLKGRRLGIRYSLFGRNLRSPAKGRLRLLF